MELAEITKQLKTVLDSLLTEHPQKKNSIFVIGCSSSEIAGGKIGKNSSEEIGQAVFKTAYSYLSKKDFILHVNVVSI